MQMWHCFNSTEGYTSSIKMCHKYDRHACHELMLKNVTKYYNIKIVSTLIKCHPFQVNGATILSTIR